MFAKRLATKPRREYRAYAPTYTARRRKIQWAALFVGVIFLYYLIHTKPEPHATTPGATIFASEPLPDNFKPLTKDTHTGQDRTIPKPLPTWKSSEPQPESFDEASQVESEREAEDEEEESERFWGAQGSRFSEMTSGLWTSTKERIFGAMEEEANARNAADDPGIDPADVAVPDRPNALVDVEPVESIGIETGSRLKGNGVPRTFLDRAAEALLQADKEKVEDEDLVDDNRPNELLDALAVVGDSKEEERKDGGEDEGGNVGDRVVGSGDGSSRSDGTGVAAKHIDAVELSPQHVDQDLVEEKKDGNENVGSEEETSFAEVTGKVGADAGSSSKEDVASGLDSKALEEGEVDTAAVEDSFEGAEEVEGREVEESALGEDRGDQRKDKTEPVDSGTGEGSSDTDNNNWSRHVESDAKASSEQSGGGFGEANFTIAGSDRMQASGAVEQVEKSPANDATSLETLENVVDQLLDIQKKPIEPVPETADSGAEEAQSQVAADASEESLDDRSKESAEKVHPDSQASALKSMNAETAMNGTETTRGIEKLAVGADRMKGSGESQALSASQNEESGRTRAHIRSRRKARLSSAAEQAAEVDPWDKNKTDIFDDEDNKLPSLRGSSVKEESTQEESKAKAESREEPTEAVVDNALMPVEKHTRIKETSSLSSTDVQDSSANSAVGQGAKRADLKSPKIEDERPEKVEEVLDSILQEIPSSVKI